jgi:hypothetical protein
VAIPTTERGYTSLGGSQWWSFLDDEPTPELLWPRSISVYERMRRQDSQVKSVLGAVTLPIRRTPWRIDPAGARDEVVQLVADDLGLPIVGVAPQAGGSNPGQVLVARASAARACSCSPLGTAVFEQVYRIDGRGPCTSPQVGLPAGVVHRQLECGGRRRTGQRRAARPS